MKKWYLVMAAVVLACSPASAETIQQSMPACVSEELFDQVVTAMRNKDEAGFGYLMSHGCVALRQGVAVSLLNRGPELHIRVYSGGEAVELWTFVTSVYPDGIIPD